MDLSKMLGLLRDPSWGAVAVVLTLVVAIGTLTWAFWFRPRKTLDFVIIATAPLYVYAPLGIRPREIELTVTFGKEAVTDPTITILRVRNSGNQAIVAEDYEQPLMFKLPGVIRILSADVTSTKPKALHPSLEWLPREFSSSDSPRVRVTPCLMNAGDFFEMTVLCEGIPGLIAAEARIAGISDVTLNSRESRDRRSNAFAFVLSMLALFLSGLALWLGRHSPPSSEDVSRSLLTVITTVIIVIVIGAIFARPIRSGDDK